MTSTLDRGRLALYGGAAIALAAFASSSLLLSRHSDPSSAVAAAALPSIVLGLVALAGRYSCRAIPLRTSGATEIALTHVLSAAAASGMWLAVWRWWAPVVGGSLQIEWPVLFGLGMLLYLMAVAFHYLVIEIEAAREAEENALRFQLLAREAELKAFKAQVDPHFLYNSLNAVASLCGSRPLAAREMSQLLADFFRLSLRLGGAERIALSQEVDLAGRYLAIEKIRFGERLNVEIAVDEQAGAVEVPPLILQPLVENAVRHGISSMVEGGTVVVAASAHDGRVRITVSNPADPDRVHAAGEGIGLGNVRGRLQAVFGGRATLLAGEAGGQYRVVMELPR